MLIEVAVANINFIYKLSVNALSFTYLGTNDYESKSLDSYQIYEKKLSIMK